MWWTTYQGHNWDPSKGFNELFGVQVQLIRADFRMAKSGRGTEKTTNFWRQIRFPDLAESLNHVGSTEAFIHIKAFDWLNQWEGPQKPAFVFDVQLGERTSTGSRLNVFDGKKDSQVTLRKLCEYQIKLVFNDPFPLSTPDFYVMHPYYKTRIDSAHAHHVFSGGRLCIFGETGDWNPNKDTALSGFYAAMRHIHFHYNKYGW
jgi:hypothetical protein